MSLEIIRMATPDRRAGEHQIDLVLGADIDAARRLVKDQDARPHCQPFGEDDLLLIATGETADSRRNCRCTILSRSFWRTALATSLALSISRTRE